ncbi:MAG: hemerythrin family protein [Desulfarculus sp.]|nr:hemerythrin family protein [Desulfarculus sp.]
MAYIEWQPEFSVGIPSIDQQHQQLVKMINELYTAMHGGQGQAALGKVLNGLAQYCVSHFANEERLMTQHGYPDLAAHKEIHAKMTAKVNGLMQDLKSGKAQMSLSVATFLKDWLTKHIQQTDMKYSPFLKGKGVS